MNSAAEVVALVELVLCRFSGRVLPQFTATEVLGPIPYDAIWQPEDLGHERSDRPGMMGLALWCISVEWVGNLCHLVE